jgi:hypothetical protein
MEKDEIVREISEMVASAEAAINSHRPELVAAYRLQKDVIVAGQRASWKSSSGEPVALTDSEIRYINRYMTSQTFISAWYSLSGDKPRRDSAFQSCATLVPKQALKKPSAAIV